MKRLKINVFLPFVPLLLVPLVIFFVWWSTYYKKFDVVVLFWAGITILWIIAIELIIGEKPKKTYPTDIFGDRIDI